jgi:hypothetical protein
MNLLYAVVFALSLGIFLSRDRGTKA